MKIKDASDKANQALEEAAATVERARLTKWLIPIAGILLLIVILMMLFSGTAGATGYHHHPPVKPPPVVVKPPPVVKPPVTPPVVVKPPVVPPVTPPVVTPPVTTPPVVTTPPATTPPPAQQPNPSAHNSRGSVVAGWLAFGATAIYFGAAIATHMAYCAQREEKWHKDNKVARCYNAERDGLPESRK